MSCYGSRMNPTEQLALPGMVTDAAEDSDQLTVFDVIAETLTTA